MRSGIVGVLTTVACLISSTNAFCADKTIDDIVEAFDCGDAYTVTECLRWIEAKGQDGEDLVEKCLLSLGCGIEQVREGQYWMESDCKDEMHPTKQRARKQWQKEHPIGNELRRRASVTTSETTSAKTTDTSTSEETTSTSVSSTTSPASIAATTTTDSSSTDSTSTTTGTTSSTSTSTTGTSESLSAGITARQTTAASSLICLATSQSTITECNTSTVNNVASTSCITTETPIVSCAAGLICSTQAAGSVICMKKDNSLTTSGLVVTIVFAVVVATLIGSLLFMCFSARKASNKAKAKRNSMFIAGASKQAENSDANLPLMQQQGPAGGAGTYDDFAAGPVSHRMPSSTYSDMVGGSRGMGKDTPPVPKLHAGLVSPPGGAYDGEDDISYQGGTRRPL